MLKNCHTYLPLEIFRSVLFLYSTDMLRKKALMARIRALYWFLVYLSSMNGTSISSRETPPCWKVSRKNDA